MQRPASTPPADEVSEKDVLLEIYSEVKLVRQLLYFFAALWFVGLLVLIGGAVSGS